MYHRPKYAIYDKKVFYCKFCRAPISNPVIYPGKKLMITRYCPHCHSVNPFPLLELQDQKFLRAGFFSNPLYPFTPHPKKGLTSKLSLFLYPLSLFINFALNIIYMPFGLVYNYIQINQATKTFFETYSTKDPSVVYLDMIRKRANEGLPYSALLMGRAYLLGERVPVDLEMAEHYLNIAKYWGKIKDKHTKFKLIFKYGERDFILKFGTDSIFKYNTKQNKETYDEQFDEKGDNKWIKQQNAA